MRSRGSIDTDVRILEGSTELEERINRSLQQGQQVIADSAILRAQARSLGERLDRTLSGRVTLSVPFSGGTLRKMSLSWALWREFLAARSAGPQPQPDTKDD